MAQRTPPTRTGVRHRPLVVTADPGLLDDLLRLAAAGSTEVTVAPDPAAARATWSTAPFVLVGADALVGCTAAGLPNRSSVIVVGRSGASGPPWPASDRLRVEYVAVLPAAEAWLVDRFADHAAGGPARARVVAVVGGSGGAGASVLATALAVSGRRRGLQTLLIDGDPLGGGVDLALGWERVQGLRWPDLVDARGRIYPPALVEALPGDASLAVLSFDRSALTEVPTEAMAAALDAGRRGRDLVVADLPRRLDDAARLALTAAERCYLVVVADLRGCAAAQHVVAEVVDHCPALALVVRVPAPHGLRASEVAEALDLPLAGTLTPDPRLTRALAAGEAPGQAGPLADLCRRLLVDLSPRHRAVAR